MHSIKQNEAPNQVPSCEEAWRADEMCSSKRFTHSEQALLYYHLSATRSDIQSATLQCSTHHQPASLRPSEPDYLMILSQEY